MSEPRPEAARWLAAAEEELATARHLTAGGFHAPACFHAQQGAEKAVKAVHHARGARTVLGHDVRALIEALAPRVPALDLLYVPTRYPNGLAAGTPAEAFSAAQAQRALGHAEPVVEASTASVSSP